VKNVRKLESEL